MAEPLASRMRPRTLDEFVGQEQFLGPGKLLRRMLDADRLGSLVFYGPPGCGKTALAHVIANYTSATFVALNATSTGTKEVRTVLERAAADLETESRRTVLFLDELHRFNKAQQDVLLPDVEAGVVTLIGATTQNPFFAVNAPLLSRSTIFTFEPLTREHVKDLLRRALADRERGLGDVDVEAEEIALDYLAEVSDGDARRALTALEVGVMSSLPKTPVTPRPESSGEAIEPSAPLEDSGRGVTGVRFTLAVAQDSVQGKHLDFDPTGDTHYDLASAFIKSMRGSDPDAAIYWLARLLESGEDTRFIARRVVICASEDVGNADPQALVVAAAALQATEFVGLPEAALSLAQAVTYIACAPKSNAATLAIGAAMKDVREGRTLAVPKHLRDSHYKGAKSFGHGTDYQYAHNYEDGWVDQAYLPEARTYYEPTDRGFEAELRRRLDALRAKKT